MKLVHIITGLDTGGAEVMLHLLLQHTNREEFDPHVISLTDVGPVGKQIEALNIPVHAMQMRSTRLAGSSMRRLVATLRQMRPDAVQTWMYHADVFGGFAARLVGIRALAWAIHQTNLSPNLNKRATLLIARFSAVLSRSIPKAIVCCSEEARRSHVAFGYDARRMCVIPNGFDLECFRPAAGAREGIRRELNLPAETMLVGLVARFHPQKDHETFVRSAARLRAVIPGVHFVLCGDGIDPSNPVLSQWIEREGLTDVFHLLGRRSDVPYISAAMDIVVLSSLGEGFPLVIGQAMACGTPCVVTDVGASSLLVGDTGRVVPPSDPAALAAAMGDLLAMPADARSALGVAARHRIQTHFSISTVAELYASLYRGMVA